MTLPRLPNDCIYDILKYLKNDRSTLFNCLFVNRFWCKETVPLLYANPFDNQGKNDHLIISTLILCFDETEISQLKSYLCVEPYNVNDNDITPKHNPLFEYIKYIEIVESRVFMKTTVNWVKDIAKEFHFKNLNGIITIFHHSIIRQCLNIKYLNIQPSYLISNSKENINIFTSNLSKLKLLKLSFYEDLKYVDDYIEFLQGISKNCLSILRLEISICTSPLLSEYFCLIIQNQNNLEAFKILKYNYLLNDVFLSLESQKGSLNFMEFEDISFSNVSFENFKNLYNLKYLDFHNCSGKSLEQFKILKFASFKLNELRLVHNTWDGEITLLIIKYLGSSLQKLLLSDKLTIPLIENIFIYCLNLVTLEITIDQDIDLLVFHYFQNLKIRILNLNFAKELSNTEVIINLAKNIPLCIKKLSIHFGLCFNNILHFEKFLENCHSDLEIINSDYYANLEYLKMILNYMKRNNNSLISLGFIKKKWNDDEINLLNKIKSKGVNIVEFYEKIDYNFIA
ncbi:hypothetical protein C1645_819374 [Glomus cerebriforme]|uniref:F-box domain-containing protein n=1 Tax=Glomus cerebriforme TaxID=658196 RepID=A0A397T6C4_9GLOM|nr:hypothetical protein C1645_819374 [Glomus cerebriforme]